MILCIASDITLEIDFTQLSDEFVNLNKKKALLSDTMLLVFTLKMLANLMCCILKMYNFLTTILIKELYTFT